MNFDRCASSARTALIVFSLTRKKLNAPLCFLFPKKPIGLFGVPEKIRFIRHWRRFGDDAGAAKDAKRPFRVLKARTILIIGT